jgi:peptide/nickel transport system permease protein
LLRFILRRLTWAVPTVFIVTFLVYLAIRIGTDPLQAYLRVNQRASKENIDKYIETNGLYEGFDGYIRGYFRWLSSFVSFEWQNTIQGNQEVFPRLKDAMANSLRLGGAATIVGISIGLAIGIFAALKPGGLRDSSANTAAFVGLSIPPYISALMLQLLFAVYWSKWSGGTWWRDALGFGEPLLPTSGVYPNTHKGRFGGFDLWLMIKHMILPVTVVAIQVIAVYSRYMRASLLDVLNSEYMRTARSKGISERRVLVRHGLRNAMIPVVTVAALDVGAIFGGLIITENIFGYPGMGKYFLDAYNNGDFPSLMPWMVVIVFTVILFNLLADISYAWLDPRIRLD